MNANVKKLLSRNHTTQGHISQRDPTGNMYSLLDYLSRNGSIAQVQQSCTLASLHSNYKRTNAKHHVSSKPFEG